jgi:hypothetical protein
MPGTPLSLLERQEIAVAVIENRSMWWAEITERVRRHPTTIMGEVEANGDEAVTVQRSPNAVPAASGAGLDFAALRCAERSRTG